MEIKNKRGETIGQIIDNIYYTTRDSAKGQIFTKKSWFEGIRLIHPVGIDKRILGTLLAEGTEKAVFTIRNYFDTNKSYTVDLKKVAEKGLKCDFNKLRGNLPTNWSEQIIFDLAWFKVDEDKH